MFHAYRKSLRKCTDSLGLAALHKLHCKRVSVSLYRVRLKTVAKKYYFRHEHSKASVMRAIESMLKTTQSTHAINMQPWLDVLLA